MTFWTIALMTFCSGTRNDEITFSRANGDGERLCQKLRGGGFAVRAAMRPLRIAAKIVNQ